MLFEFLTILRFSNILINKRVWAAAQVDDCPVSRLHALAREVSY